MNECFGDDAALPSGREGEEEGWYECVIGPNPTECRVWKEPAGHEGVSTISEGARNQARGAWQASECANW